MKRDTRTASTIREQQKSEHKRRARYFDATQRIDRTLGRPPHALPWALSDDPWRSRRAHGPYQLPPRPWCSAAGAYAYAERPSRAHRRGNVPWRRSRGAVRHVRTRQRRCTTACRAAFTARARVRSALEHPYPARGARTKPVAKTTGLVKIGVWRGFSYFVGSAGRPPHALPWTLWDDPGRSGRAHGPYQLPRKPWCSAAGAFAHA